MMIPSPLSVLAMPLKLSASVSLLLTVPISYVIPMKGDSSYIGASKLFANKVRSPLILPLFPVQGDALIIVEPKENLLAAATILSTESRHSAWLDSVIRQGSAWSGPFDVISPFNDGV
jgi:hypothetical protein